MNRRILKTAKQCYRTKTWRIHI